MKNDCEFGEDEKYCIFQDNFFCTPNEQIAYQFLCDYNQDCSNNADEINCSKFKKNLKCHFFRV